MSLAELLVASGIMLTLTGTVGSVLLRAQFSFRVQPEVADMQQRLRVAASTFGRDLLMAGAGPAFTAQAGSLVQQLPGVAPYRRGQSDDVRAGVFYRPDAVSVLYVSTTRAEADIERTIDTGRELLVDAAPNCGALAHERVCGFTTGMRVAFFDARGAFDLGTVTRVAGNQLTVLYGGALSSSYNGGAVVAEVVAVTYYLRPDGVSGASQLVRYDGFLTDRPVVDNVVGMQVEYFGDPRPPRVLPAAAPGDPVRPVTSYGPAPPADGADDPRDLWGAGENCVFADAGGPVPRLGALGAGVSPVPLDPSRLRDGPWCPDALHPARFDADLLRIRRVRVRLRVQVAVAALRGPAGRLFAKGGTAASAELFAPDQQIVLDVTPRNLGGAP